MRALVMGLPGGMEWVILLIVALLLFGGSRIAGMGKGAGRAIREFKEEMNAPTGVDASAPAETTVTSTPAVTSGSTTPALAADNSTAVDAEIVISEPRKES